MLSVLHFMGLFFSMLSQNAGSAIGNKEVSQITQNSLSSLNKGGQHPLIVGLRWNRWKKNPNYILQECSLTQMCPEAEASSPKMSARNDFLTQQTIQI